MIRVNTISYIYLSLVKLLKDITRRSLIPTREARILYRYMVYNYLLTIRKHNVLDFVDKDSLDEILTTLEMNLNDIVITNVRYEIEYKKYRQLHMHCIVESKRPIRYASNSKICGYICFWRQVYDLQGALNYINKDSNNKYTQEQILDMNYFNHHYGF